MPLDVHLIQINHFRLLLRITSNQYDNSFEKKKENEMGLSNSPLFVVEWGIPSDFQAKTVQSALIICCFCAKSKAYTQLNVVNFILPQLKTAYYIQNFVLFVYYFATLAIKPAMLSIKTMFVKPNNVVYATVTIFCLFVTYLTRDEPCTYKIPQMQLKL